jgi:SAM-dependent methyltransferase
MHAIYDDLVSWYPLLDPVGEHAAEVGTFVAAFDRAIVGPGDTMLELGSGAGNNAFHAKGRFACTLADPSEPMLALSRGMNPECEHIAGDMRSLRIGRTFDAVLIHDAVVYMTTERELREAIATAFAHTRPGGAAVFATDCFTETLVEETVLIEGADGARSMRCLEWSWDPDPSDTTYQVDYAFLLRDGDGVRAVHDRHVEGLFPKATWLQLLRDAGFAPEVVERPIGGGAFDEIFLCRRAMA